MVKKIYLIIREIKERKDSLCAIWADERNKNKFCIPDRTNLFCYINIVMYTNPLVGKIRYH